MNELRIDPHFSAARADNMMPERKVALLAQAKEFESIFVAQMLNYSGLTEALTSDSSFGGGAFSSMLVEQYAEQLVENGGFGIAEHVYEQLLEQETNSATNTAA